MRNIYLQVQLATLFVISNFAKATVLSIEVPLYSYDFQLFVPASVILFPFKTLTTRYVTTVLLMYQLHSFCFTLFNHC